MFVLIICLQNIIINKSKSFNYR